MKLATGWSSAGVSAAIRGELLRSRLNLPSTWVWRAIDSATVDPVVTAARVAATSTAADVVIAPAASPGLIAVASAFGAQKGWPVLLVTTTGVPAATQTELVRRKAARLHIVGTTVEIPAAIVSALASLSPSVTRYAGATDSDISVTVANALALPVGTPVMVVAAADLLSSALAGGAAAAAHRPLVLLPGGSVASANVVAYLAARAPTRTYVVGSTTSVADSVVAGWSNVTRLTGTTAIDVSTAVLATLVGLTPSRMVLTSAVGVMSSMVAAPGAPVFVVGTTLPAPVAQFLQRGVSQLTVVAGVSATAVITARRA